MIRAASIALLFAIALCAGGCSIFKPHRASTNLQAHIGQAQTASQATSKHISDFKSSVDTVDYKSSRARKLWEEGVPQ